MFNRIKYGLWTSLLIGLSILGISNKARGQQHISFEFLPGGAIISPSPLFIRQEEYSDINYIARYSTKSFRLPIYYSWRLAYILNENSSLSLELNHLKIYLDNPVTEIDQFSITHGFNQLWFNYTRNIEYFNLTAGLGPVIAHPENTIRGLKFDQNQGIQNKGYYLSGISMQFALQKQFFFCNHFFFSLETKLNMAYSKINIVNGFARVSILGINGLAGFGIVI